MSRIYEDNASVLVFDMGERLAETWARFESSHGNVTIDKAAMNGEMVLSPAHAAHLAARLLQWSGAPETPRESKGVQSA